MSGERRKERLVQPIKPEEVTDAKRQHFPDAVIESFNTLIVQNAAGGSSCFTQDNVVDLMVEKGLDCDEIFKKGWLNVEALYRAVGWNVTYDKPGYNESGRASFIFESSKKN